MKELMLALFGFIWDGLKGLPIFDLGISWASLFTGMIVISVSIWMMKTVFNIGNSEVYRIGKDYRQKRSVDKNRKNFRKDVDRQYGVK